MANPETPEAGEPTEGGERTRESEIKANVEFWQDLGVEVDEADVRAKIEELPEVEGFDFCIYVPQGIKFSELWQIYVKNADAEPDTIGLMDNIVMPRSNDQSSIAVAMQGKQMTDDFYWDQAERERTGDFTPLKWEKEGKEKDHFYITPVEFVIADMRWYKETGFHLGASQFQNTDTLFLYTRDKSGKTNSIAGRECAFRIMTTAPRTSRLSSAEVHLGGNELTYNLHASPRQVITKDTKV